MTETYKILTGKYDVVAVNQSIYALLDSCTKRNCVQ